MRFREILQLMEVSDKVKNLMRNKFQKQDPNLTDDQIDYYLNRWDRFSKTLPADKRDITRLSFDQLEQLIDAAEAKQAVKGKRAEPSDPVEGEIYNKNNLVIYKGDSRPKCIQYGQGYTWCISRRDSGNLYTRYRFKGDEPIFYFVFDKDRDQDDDLHAVVIYVNKDNEYWLAKSINSGDKPVSWEQIVSKMPKLEPLKSLFKPQPITPEEQADFDKYGHDVDDATFSNFTYQEKVKYIDFGSKISFEQQDKLPYELLAAYAKQNPQTISESSWNRLKLGDFKYVFNMFVEMVIVGNQRFAQNVDVEKLSSDKKQYALAGIAKDRQELATDPEKAFEYAKNVLKGPFPAGEALIAKDPERAYRYAVYVLKPAGIKGFPAGEAAIAKNNQTAFEYAKNVLKGPFPAGEAAIAKFPGWAYTYAKDFLEKPFPAGEAAIAKYPEWAYDYAINVLKKPFPAGEAAIAKDPWWAYRYAINVLKPAGINRFPAGEAAIAKDTQGAYDYAKQFNLEYIRATKTFKKKNQVNTQTQESLDRLVSLSGIKK